MFTQFGKRYVTFTFNSPQPCYRDSGLRNESSSRDGDVGRDDVFHRVRVWGRDGYGCLPLMVHLVDVLVQGTMVKQPFIKRHDNGYST